MKKNIMLTLLIVYVILISVGCKSGKLFIDSNFSESSEDINNETINNNSLGDEETISGELVFFDEKLIGEIKENFVYNTSR